MTEQQLTAMREWIADNEWYELDPEDIDDLTDEQVVRGIERHYIGGVKQFIQDGD